MSFKDKIIDYLAIIIIITLFGFAIYIEFFVCGGFTGTFSEVPRYCWFLK
jgi:hypothetical protein